MPINKKEITKEMLEKAMQCKTAEDLMALAKAEGVAVTKDEAKDVIGIFESGFSSPITQ